MPHPSPDRPLSLEPLLADLLAQRRISPDGLASFRPPPSDADHPLEQIARQRLADLQRPGQWLDLDTLCQWLADQAGQPFVTIDPLSTDLAGANGLISAAFAHRHGLLVLAQDTSSVTIASAQPYVGSWEADLARILRRRIVRVVASPLQIRQLSQSLLQLARSVDGARQLAPVEPASSGPEPQLELGATAAEPQADEAHVVGIVDWLLQYAFDQGASDIHLEPRRDQGRLRLRIDGLLHEVYQFPPAVTLAVVSRLKSLGRMNVAERRRPQDGRIKTRSPAGDEVELRLSTLPTSFGEKLVMRIFDPRLGRLDFPELGLEGEALARWQAMMRQPHGIILVTGPTGSGKTSTLYTTLRQLATPEVNLCTLEDPIEIVEPAFTQTQVQPGIDLGFANGVRALLRQDPDIIMVGEIRDAETAQVAIQAALTGHLVLSTLHTNDACGAIGRLQELGVAPYLIRATLVGVMAQRLVRTLCDHCKSPMSLDTELWHSLAGEAAGEVPGGACQGIGCRECRQTGYRGRTGLYELLVLDEPLRGLLDTGGDQQALRRQARASGWRSLRQDGARKIAAGRTSVAEVLRVAP